MKYEVGQQVVFKDTTPNTTFRGLRAIIVAVEAGSPPMYRYKLLDRPTDGKWLPEMGSSRGYNFKPVTPKFTNAQEALEWLESDES